MVCDWSFGEFRSVVFVSAFQGSLLVIVQFRAIIEQIASKMFPGLSYSCLLQE